MVSVNSQLIETIKSDACLCVHLEEPSSHTSSQCMLNLVVKTAKTGLLAYLTSASQKGVDRQNERHLNTVCMPRKTPQDHRPLLTLSSNCGLDGLGLVRRRLHVRRNWRRKPPALCQSYASIAVVACHGAALGCTEDSGECRDLR
jgi:hypothetical protein